MELGVERLEQRTRIDGVEVVAVEDEFWFIQHDRVCWISKQEAWRSLGRLAPALREKGFSVSVSHFPKKLREFILRQARLNAT